MDSIESGIPGLDDLFNGGFPKGKMILLSGPPGAGKTVFAMQFLIAGAIENSEPGIFVAFDDLPSHIRRDMKSFGWDIEELEAFDPPLITIIDGFSDRVGLASKERKTIRANVDSLLITILDVLKETGATRVVIDSLTTLSSVVKTPEQVRKEILTLSAILGEQGCTSIVTAEVRGTPSAVGGIQSLYGVEEYSTQGAIVLNYVELPSGEFKRVLLIQKMRGVRHVFGWREFEITENGIVVYPDRMVGRGHLFTSLGSSSLLTGSS